MNNAIIELLYKMGDDALVIGHRNSEWTGLGPILEEDIAFSSLAQDQIGHALAIYSLLETGYGQPNPDLIAFARTESAYKCCQFVELPIGEYDFSLMRHFLFDHAEQCRFAALQSSSVEPLAALARKIKGELKYHTLHGDLWITKLGKGTEESHARMQSSLNECMPYALGMFEEGDFEQELIAKNIFIGEKALQAQWLEIIAPIIKNAQLQLPDLATIEPKLGGRHGYHTEFLAPMLSEMSEVYRSEDATAVW